MKMNVNVQAIREAQADPNWKFVGGTAIRGIQPGLGASVVKALGGPELLPETHVRPDRRRREPESGRLLSFRETVLASL